MTSTNTLVISSQATFFEARFPCKGKTADITTEDFGPIWEQIPEIKQEAPENLDLDQIIPENQQDSPHPNQRGASPDQQHGSDPSDDSDNDDGNEFADRQRDYLDEERRRREQEG